MKFSRKYLRKLSSFAIIAAAILLVLTLVSPGGAQDKNAAGNSNQTNTNTVAAESPTPIPFPEIVQQAESASASLAEFKASVSGKSKPGKVERKLPELTDDINAELKPKKATKQPTSPANCLSPSTKPSPKIISPFRTPNFLRSICRKNLIAGKLLM